MNCKNHPINDLRREREFVEKITEFVVNLVRSCDLWVRIVPYASTKPVIC